MRPSLQLLSSAGRFARWGSWNTKSARSEGLSASMRRNPTGLPNYTQLMKLGTERKGAILLDIGCSFGNGARMISADGWPVENIVASDIQAASWDIGHALHRSTHKTFPATFVEGDVFDPKHLEVAPVLDTLPDVPPPKLSTLTSLNPLRGHVSAIHAGDFFHLFTEEQQASVARALAGLLSPEPGSIILGTHSTAPKKGLQTATRGEGTAPITQFCHSPKSWTKLWDGEVFKKGTVKVDAILHKDEWSSEMVQYSLRWSVMRL